MDKHRLSAERGIRTEGLIAVFIKTMLKNTQGHTWRSISIFPSEKDREEKKNNDSENGRTWKEMDGKDGVKFP